MVGRRVLAGSLAVLLLTAGVVAGGSAVAGPATASEGSGVVTGPVERIGRVWTKASSGAAHTCAVRKDRSLWCWGFNDYGQLGLDDTTDRLVPTQVGTDTNWAQVATGGNHTCGIRTDRSLWCWGWNDDGQLGLGNTTDRLRPFRVGDGTDWTRVTAVGGDHTCGVRTDRSLWCWGNNRDGQLGFGDHAMRLVPTRVGADTDWARVIAGWEHTCGVRTDRSLWCWGDNEAGQLGLGDTTDRVRPTRVGTDADWARVTPATGSYTCGLRTDRSLWCWGANGKGQLGLGDTTDRLVPTQVGTSTDWTQVTAGDLHTCGTRTDRSLWCWGYNGDGQLGLGDTTARLVPTRVGADTDWARVTAGWLHTCGVRTDRSLWCWGWNSYGQLGLEDIANRLVPTRV